MSTPQNMDAITKNVVTNTPHAICNQKTGDALAVDNFSMKPDIIYLAQPKDFDRNEWTDKGREIDSMLWLVRGDFPDKFEIVNKKSGLCLGLINSAKGTLTQSVTPVFWRAIPFEDGSMQIYYMPPNAKDVDTHKLAQIEIKTWWPRGKLVWKERGAGEKEDLFTWEFRKVDYQSDVFQPFNIAKDDYSLSYATAGLEMVSDVAYYVGQVASDAGEIAGGGGQKTGKIVSLVTNIIGGLTTFTANVINFVQIGEEDHDDSEDPIVKLYNKLIPEIRRIVEQAIDQAFIDNNIGDALGVAKSGRTHLENALTLLQSKIPADATKIDITPILEKPDTLFEQLIGSANYSRFVDELRQSDEYYMNALNSLSERPNEAVYFPVWVQIGTQRLITLILLAYLGKSDLKLAKKAILTLRNEIDNKFNRILSDRLEKIDKKTKVDNHYRLGRDIGLDIDSYVQHVTDVTDIAFNRPRNFIKKLDEAMAKLG